MEAGKSDPTVRIDGPTAIRIRQASEEAVAIPGYTILGRIGAGGMGTVYKARQASMDRSVALKVLHPQVAAEDGGYERFLREARAIARLSHPNVVAGIDAGETNGICYLVMEYLPGESADAVLRRRGKLPWRDAVRITRQVAMALEHARQNGLVHRDIKPGNIILLEDGTAKLADLGLARIASGDCTLTQSGAIVGSPSYLSPEQAQGTREIDGRSDIYSLGLTLYELVTGVRAYPGNNPMAVINARLSRDPEWDSLTSAGATRDLLAVVETMTRRDPGQRYATPLQLIEDLDALLAGRRPRHARTRSRLTGALAAVACIAAAASILLAAWPAPVAAQDPPEPDARYLLMIRDARIGLLEAIEKARPHAGGGTVFKAELEAGYPSVVYSVDFAQDGKTCNVLVDAARGHLVERKIDEEDHTAHIAACKTPLAAAIEAALRSTPGRAVEADLVQPGKGVIVVKVVASGRVAAVHIDASTGTVVSKGVAP